MTQRYKRLVPGGQLSAFEENLKSRSQEGLESSGGPGGLSFGCIQLTRTVSGGFDINHSIPIPLWARITGMAPLGAATLASPVGPSDTTLSLVSGIGFPEGQLSVQIDSEIIVIVANPALPSIFTVIQRGANTTIPAAHLAGATVTALIQGYTWQEQQNLGQGDFTVGGADYFDGRNDGGGLILAYPVGGGSVPINSIVQLWPGYDGGQTYYLFFSKPTPNFARRPYLEEAVFDDPVLRRGGLLPLPGIAPTSQYCLVTGSQNAHAIGTYNLVFSATATVTPRGDSGQLSTGTGNDGIIVGGSATSQKRVIVLMISASNITPGINLSSSYQLYKNGSSPITGGSGQMFSGQASSGGFAFGTAVVEAFPGSGGVPGDPFNPNDVINVTFQKNEDGLATWSLNCTLFTVQVF
jgi:hypothetical protein